MLLTSVDISKLEGVSIFRFRELAVTAWELPLYRNLLTSVI